VTAARQFSDFLLNHEQQRLALQYGFRPSDLSVSLTDNGIANNPFKQLQQLSPGQAFTPQNAVPTPHGDVIDALIAQWQNHNKNV
jgi:ABC-type sulfate transport system substrate-binding protein